MNWATTASNGMTVEIELRDVAPREANPFKGLRFGKDNGQRFKGWFGPYSELIELSSIPEVESVYSGECQLMYYGDTCNKGVTVKFLLDSGPDGTDGTHPFHDRPCGRIEGMDLYVSFWAVDDDEALIPKKTVRAKTPFHQLSEVRQSNLVVGDPEFVNFLANRLDRLVGSAVIEASVAEKPRDWATEVVRAYLGVESRAVMNHETMEGLVARKRWKALMSEYFQSEEFHVRRFAPR